jgi:hypothetical protein
LPHLLEQFLLLTLLLLLGEDGGFGSLRYSASLAFLSFLGFAAFSGGGLCW